VRICHGATLRSEAAPAARLAGVIFGACGVDLVQVRVHFAKFEGELVIAEDPLQSTATATIDLNSISTNNEMRDNHIRSADFFEVETYPEMTYRSTSEKIQIVREVEAILQADS
jgi:polyisoprenoid-binding protein YceI